MKKPIFLFSVILVIGLLFSFDYNHVENHTIVVNDVQTLQHVSSNDGNVSTSYENRVLTDKGVFRVETSGLFAHPEVLGMINKGDTLEITTRGIEISLLGKYRFIVTANKE